MIDMAMIQNLELALDQEPPAFLSRLLAFIQDYGIEDMPMLAWQCRPCEEAEIEVLGPPFLDVLPSGAVASTRTEGWCGFRSTHKPVPVFAGLSSAEPAGAPGWASELHTDGHLIAGLWDFSHASPAPSHGHCITDSHAEAFLDFAQFAERVARLVAPQGRFQMTATLVHAANLRFRWSDEIQHPAPRQVLREVLQWRVRSGPVSELRAIGARMANDFRRAYGI